MFQINFTTKFKKDYKKISKNKILLKEVDKAIDIISDSGNLPKKYMPHNLIGNYKDCTEAHIKPDLLIIWFVVKPDKTINLIRLGSHSDLF
ncbi:MAG: type II toxin-antitoxin system YafQ family toxin [Bacteroidales bacterium]